MSEPLRVWFDLPPANWLPVPKAADQAWLTGASELLLRALHPEALPGAAPSPRSDREAECAQTVARLVDAATTLPDDCELVAALAVPGGLPQPVVTSVGQTDPARSLDELAGAGSASQIEPPQVERHDGPGVTVIRRDVLDDATIAVTVCAAHRTAAVDARAIWQSPDLALAPVMDRLLRELVGSVRVEAAA